MRLHENDNGEVGLYKLPDTGKPAFPTLVRVLRGRGLNILKGRWIIFPTVCSLRQFGSFVSDMLLANFTAWRLPSVS